MQHCYGTVRFTQTVSHQDILFNCGVNIQICCHNKDTAYIWVSRQVYENKELSRFKRESGNKRTDGRMDGRYRLLLMFYLLPGKRGRQKISQSNHLPDIGCGCSRTLCGDLLYRTKRLMEEDSLRPDRTAPYWRLRSPAS